MGEASRLGRRGVLAAAVSFAVGLLVLAWVAGPAGAAFPGANGKIAFGKFGLRDEEPRIVSVNPDGSGMTNLAPGFSPSYSPDGTRIVFERFTGETEEDFNQDIFVMDANGSNPQQVTSGPAYDHSPVFLDNNTIAFVRDSRRNGTDIFKKVLGAPGSQNLTDTPAMYEESLASSPDGTQIAFSRFGRSSDLFVMDAVVGSEPRRLTRTGSVEEFGPDWSPDGLKIVFSSYRFSESPGGEFEEDAEISVINVSGTGRRDLTSGPALDLGPAYAPNGEKIAFSKVTFSGGEQSDIFTMRDDGTGVRRLTDTRAFEFGPDWQAE